jgi:DnaK suppressor protein
MMSQMTTQEIEQFRMLLSQRRNELHSELHDMPGAQANGNGSEFDESSLGRLSRMDALQCHAMEEESRRRRALELTRIERALERIAQGDYGICRRCGGDIAPARLRADPANPVCIACAD